MTSELSALNSEIAQIYGPDRKRGRPAGWRPAGSSDRVAHMTALREEGRTLQEIGASYGITRERVRQLLEREGVASKVSRAHDPLAVVAFTRTPNATSLNVVAVRFGMRSKDLKALFFALGLADAVNRLFRWRTWRRRESRRRVFLASVRAFIDREGRLPSMAEFGVKQGVPKHPDVPYASELIRAFGSITAMWAVLGVTARQTGTPGHLNPRSANHSCRRGHEFTEANTYTYTDSDGRVSRQCRACQKFRRTVA